MRREFAYIMVACCVSVTAAAQQQADPLSPLREKYAWGSIYLTYGNLADVSNLLNNKRRELLGTNSDADVLDLLASFLARHSSARFGDGVAFLQLDLNGLRAGFMRAAQYEGVVTPLPWTPDQVRKTALWADRFLSNAVRIAALQERLSSGDIDITSAWSIVSSTKNDVFTSENRATSLDLSLRNLLDTRASEFTALKAKDPELHAKVEAFQKQIDTAIAERPRFKYDSFMVMNQRTLEDWNIFGELMPKAPTVVIKK